MKIAIIIPTYNEQENIKDLVSKIFNLLNDVEIFIIDDTINAGIKEILKNFSKINYVHRGKKLGRGSAVLEGLTLAIKKNLFDVFIEMDADLSHDPEEINFNLHKFKNENLDLLVSSRYLKKSSIINWGLNRKLFSRASNMLARYLLKIPICDYTNGFRIYSLNSAKFISRRCGKIGGGFVILSEILMQLYYNDYKIGEIETVFRNRIRGQSSVTMREIIQSFFGLIKLYKIKKSLR